MIILSKLADYGVIVATHLAAYPDRQVTAGTVATETRLPQATVAKLLKALAHAGLEMLADGREGLLETQRAFQVDLGDELLELLLAGGQVLPLGCQERAPLLLARA